MGVVEGGLEHPDVIALLNLHLQSMQLYSPPESIHALNIDELRREGVTFWSIWQERKLKGCGALKMLDPDHGEIKSMRTSPEHLREGIAQRLLEHIIIQAKQRGCCRLSLETGGAEAFLAARRLYEKNGFSYCTPFADYCEDPHSVFMTKTL